MAEVFLRRLSRWQAENQSADFADLRTSSYQPQADAERLSHHEFRDRFADHLQQSEFELVIASDPALVGCAYGFLIERDGGWWDRFTQVPPQLMELTEVLRTRQIFVLAELMVTAGRRRQGIGGRLVDQLLSRTSAPLAVALMEPDRRETQDAFASWGWLRTGELTPRDDAKPLESWTKRLPH